MRAIGKVAPTDTALQQAIDDGFDAVELYLEPQHLKEDLDALVDRLTSSELEIVSAHTPHDRRNRQELFQRTATLCDRMDALCVFHTGYMIEKKAVKAGEDLDVERIAFENQPGTSRQAIEQLILGQGHDLVLDTGHLFMASTASFHTDLTALAPQAAHIHLCDSSLQQDGLAFGDGRMDIDRTISILSESAYDGDVVLEVPVDDQGTALTYIQERADQT